MLMRDLDKMEEEEEEGAKEGGMSLFEDNAFLQTSKPINHTERVMEEEDESDSSSSSSEEEKKAED